MIFKDTSSCNCAAVMENEVLSVHWCELIDVTVCWITPWLMPALEILGLSGPVGWRAEPPWFPLHTVLLWCMSHALLNKWNNCQTKPKNTFCLEASVVSSLNLVKAIIMIFWLHIFLNINNQFSNLTSLLPLAHEATGAHLVIGYPSQSAAAQFFSVAPVDGTRKW